VLRDVNNTQHLWQYLSQKPGFYLCLGWWDLLDGAGGSDTASYLDVTKVIADRDRQRSAIATFGR
jgi:hypothetical protein